ncbi:DUF6480 family protein [Streptomyces sp. NPDC048018]|uniref:DUF6480 family protein n=1 Tax=Streptomyces sp. NPDC048018 TaxID=3365499 RepID=UPI003718446C
MTVPSNPDPGPRTLPPGAGPGVTSPAETGTGTATGPRRPPRRGWAAGPLVALWAVVLLCALFFLVYAIVLAAH